MQFKPLANTGILVPEICLGTMTFGEQNTQAQAFEIGRASCRERV